MTDDGTDAAAEFDNNWTVSPPVGAGADRFIVAVEDVRPTTVTGLSVTDARVGGVTVREPLTATVPKLPVTVALTGAATAVVLTVNVANAIPAGIETLAGTTTDFRLLDNFTVRAVIELLVSVTEPFEETPPETVEGLKLTD